MQGRVLPVLGVVLCLPSNPAFCNKFCSFLPAQGHGLVHLNLPSRSWFRPPVYTRKYPIFPLQSLEAFPNPAQKVAGTTTVLLYLCTYPSPKMSLIWGGTMVDGEHRGPVPRGRREPNGRQWGHSDTQPIYLEVIYFFVLFCQFSFVCCFLLGFFCLICFVFLSSHHKHCIAHLHKSRKTHIPIPIETMQ